MKKTIKTAAVILMLTAAIIFSHTVSAADGGGSGYLQNEDIKEVYLGGIPFGLKLYSDELTVVGFSDVDTDGGNSSPAYDAGIRKGDCIVYVNGEKPSSVESILDACSRSKGSDITIECRRGEKVISFKFAPALSKSEGKYKTGMWIKDGTAGIGTVTYIVPETKAFAGLGHGICDADGKLEKISSGIVSKADIQGVEAGSEGSPGELIGSIGDDKIGTLVSNTKGGVFGIYSDIPSGIGDDDLIEVAGADGAKEGDAYIKCTLGGNVTDTYSVKIKSIDSSDDTYKNYVIEITDKKLLERSGGIVQGMSGSPIVQDGKLIGAVTHVFVNDPTKGYGISISEMQKCMPDILT